MERGLDAFSRFVFHFSHHFTGGKRTAGSDRPFISNLFSHASTMLVPLRFLAECLRGIVEWNHRMEFLRRHDGAGGGMHGPIRNRSLV